MPRALARSGRGMALQSIVMLLDLTTNIDPQGRNSWDIDDAVVRLRLWAADYAHHLPEPPVPLCLGSAATCQVRLHDDTGQLSRKHAMLVPEPTGWEIRDLDSRNGLKVGGLPATTSTLQAGVKLQLGGLTLVAESLKFIGLRSLVCRLLGWAPERRAAVDEALQSLRDCALHRTPLALLGDGDLVPVAARLHRETLGPSAPFVGYDGGDVAASIQAATHGTLCVPNRRLAAASEVLDAVCAVSPAARPRLVLCVRTAGDAAAMGAKSGRLAVISIPPLSSRVDEVSRLVHEAAIDVARDMGAPATGFTMRDFERLESMTFSGMGHLEDSIRRVVAMRTWGVTAGAKKLGLKHSSLSEWARAKSRKLST